jgi:hypothetical protein
LAILEQRVSHESAEWIFDLATLKYATPGQIAEQLLFLEANEPTVFREISDPKLYAWLKVTLALDESQWTEKLPELPKIQIRTHRHQELDALLEPYPWIDARLLSGPELALGFAATVQPGEALYSVEQLGGWGEKRIVRMTQQQATELQRKRVAMAMESSPARRLIEEFDHALWQRILGQCTQIRNIGRAMCTRDVSLFSFVQQVEERWGKEVADWFNLHFRYASVFNTQPKLVQLADALYDHHLQPYVQTILSAEFANWLKNLSARAKVNAVL